MVTDHLSYYDIDYTGIVLTCQWLFIKFECNN